MEIIYGNHFFYQNDGCARVYCISRIYLLDMNQFLTKNNHHYFSLKLHLMAFGFFRHQRGWGEISVLVCLGFFL